MGRQNISPTSYYVPVTPYVQNGGQWRRELYYDTEAHTWQQQPYCRFHFMTEIYIVSLSCPTGRAYPDPNTCHLERALKAQLNQLIQNYLTHSTRGTYSTGYRRFAAFCSRYKVLSLSASKLTVNYFAAGNWHHIPFGSTSQQFEQHTGNRHC